MAGLLVIDSDLEMTSGCAIVTDTGAYLFTDGRYFLQASQQLDKYAHSHVFFRIS